MLSEIGIDEITTDPVEWKLRYKKLITKAYDKFAAESKFDWRIQGNAESRLRIFRVDDQNLWKIQGVLYCKAKRLVALWKDVNFERRVGWGDLWFGQICETVVENYHSRTIGAFSISKEKTQSDFKLHWTHENPATGGTAIMVQKCKYRNNIDPNMPHQQWTIIYIQTMDQDPKYGDRCYIRMVMFNEPISITGRLLEQMAVCERFCRDDAQWEAIYSPEAMRALDLKLRI